MYLRECHHGRCLLPGVRTYIPYFQYLYSTAHTKHSSSGSSCRATHFFLESMESSRAQESSISESRLSPSLSSASRSRAPPKASDCSRGSESCLPEILLLLLRGGLKSSALRVLEMYHAEMMLPVGRVGGFRS